MLRVAQTPLLRSVVDLWDNESYNKLYNILTFLDGIASCNASDYAYSITFSFMWSVSLSSVTFVHPD